MKQSVDIVFTGGGTAGHVLPNVRLINDLKKEGFSCAYIGSRTGPEFKLTSNLDIPFKSISCGKLRRYFSFQNFLDLFKNKCFTFYFEKFLYFFNCLIRLFFNF